MYGEIEHEKIEELLWALQNKRIIVISEDLLNCANLHLPENAFPLHMYPLELVFHTGRVHLSGLAVNSKQFLLFAIDETFKYHFTNEGFNRKKLMPIYNQGFDRMFGIAAPMNNRIYTIKIEYTQSLGESEYKFFLHHSQKWSRMKNGNYMVTFKCSIGRELFGYLGFMLDKIKVHQPKVLKDLFVKKAKQIAAIHEQNLELDEEVANADY
jgi:predicted DNA-binding transcriptional regulator YafY